MCKAETLTVTRHPVILRVYGEEVYIWGQKFCHITSRRKRKNNAAVSPYLRKAFC